MKVPSDPALEQKILGTALLMVEHVGQIVELDKSDFFLPRHQKLFAQIKDNYSKGVSADFGMDADDVSEISSHVTNDVTQAISILREKANARGMIELFRNGINRLMEDTPSDMVSSHVISRMSETSIEQDSISSIGESLHHAFNDIIAIKDGTKQLGLTTGLDFEKHISGFESGKLYIIAARPAMGKSAFALEIIRRIAKTGVPVGMMSLEMSHTSLAVRMLTSELGIDGKALRQGRISDDQVLLMQSACNRLADLPVYFDDNSYVTAESLRRRAMHFKRKKDIGMLVIDYLQLTTGSNDNRERDIAEVSRTCKIIAKELEIPVVALAQLSRAVEMRDNKRPRLSDLRESGAIEQDADAVMFLYRPEYYGVDIYGDGEDDALRGTSTKNVCEIIIGKNRDGETGIVPHYFYPEIMRFENRASHWLSDDM